MMTSLPGSVKADSYDSGTVLGLDLGVASVGWCLIQREGPNAGEVLNAGVRIFPAGVEGSLSEIAAGRDKPRAANRRAARLQRRQHFRRSQRLRRVFGELQAAGLLPEGDSGPQGRHELLSRVDQAIRDRHVTGDVADCDTDTKDAKRRAQHVWLYRLRSLALDQPLDCYALGRVFYHLAQRRGFRSNRKTDGAKKDEKLGEVERGIQGLRAEMIKSGARSLGEYFSWLDPETTRIRERWTARAMYQEEFEAIWSAQAAHHPEVLTDRAHARIRRAIFFQRPLKSQKGLIGCCSVEPRRRRAMLASPIAQRFRFVKTVNNLKVIEASGELRPLEPEEREKLIEALSQRGDMTWAQVARTLGLRRATKTRPDGARFNLEEGGEKKLIGDRTAAKMREAIGEAWDELGDDRRHALAADLLAYEHRHALIDHLVDHFGLDRSAATAAAEVALERGYAAFSRRALKRILPRVEAGEAEMTTLEAEYPDRLKFDPVDKLPPVRKALGSIRNPAVERVLTEMRKVVNAIISRYGKPNQIRVELARDLKRPRQARARIAKRNRDRQQMRQAICKKMPRWMTDPHPRDYEKWLLAEECGWVCPYTGRSITPANLFGPEPEVHVEHIIPRSISLDDGFLNKTLCHADENQRKRNRTPHAAYAGDPTRFEQILSRVRRFNQTPVNGQARDWALDPSELRLDPKATTIKLERFQMDDETVAVTFQDFAQRHLNDTRHASRRACEYLARLYGGRWDADGDLRVRATSGTVTSVLRGKWGLNDLIGFRSTKDRTDHRHHAIDAAVVALTNQATIQRLAAAAAEEERQSTRNYRSFIELQPPWPGLKDRLGELLDALVVSHRVDRRVSGPLHKDTLYSPPTTGDGGEKKHRLRRQITALSVSELTRDAIVDPRVRQAVTEAWEQAGRGKPGDVFADPANQPFLKPKNGKNGRCTPIKSVRVYVNDKPWKVSRNSEDQRWAMTADLHHLAIVAEQTPRGERWRSEPVDMMTAYRRQAAKPKQPVLQTDWGPGRHLVFALCKGDTIEMDRKDGKGRSCYVVRGISATDLTVREHRDGRSDSTIKADGDRARYRIRTAEDLRKRHARKVTISPGGEVVSEGVPGASESSGGHRGKRGPSPG